MKYSRPTILHAEYLFFSELLPRLYGELNRGNRKRDVPPHALMRGYLRANMHSQFPFSCFRYLTTGGQDSTYSPYSSRPLFTSIRFAENPPDGVRVVIDRQIATRCRFEKFRPR